MALCKGNCKWFDSTKGYGFITTEDGEELFVHQSEIHAKGFRSLFEGEPVQCVVVEENGRKKAINVTGPDGGFVRGENERQQQGGGGGGGNRRGGGNGGYNRGGGGGGGNGNGGGRGYNMNNNGNYYPGGQGGGNEGYNNYDRGNNYNQYGEGRD